MTRSQVFANGVSGILSFLGPTYFAWTIYQNHIPQSLATWSMTLLLDGLGLLLALTAGNKKPYLQLGWFLAAFCIVSAILTGKSPWHWGGTENISLLLCFFAVVLWQKLNAKVAIFAFIAGFIVAAIPLMSDYWNEPQRSTAWIWALTIFTCFLSIYGAKKQTVEYIAVPWGAALMNGFILFLCLR
jgi:hypothetical protein